MKGVCTDGENLARCCVVANDWFVPVVTSTKRFSFGKRLCLVQADGSAA